MRRLRPPGSPGSRPAGRGSLFVAIAAVLVLVIGSGFAVAATGLVGGQGTESGGPVTAPSPGTSPSPDGPAAIPPAAAPPAAGLPVVAAGAPLPDPARLAAALQAPLRDRGLAGRAGMQVADLATGAVLFDQDGQKPAVTASTTKLLTAVAALDRLGPQTRLQTRVFAAGDVLYLVGAGDPTLSRDGTPPIGGAVAGAAPARIDDLARQVRAAGVRRVSAVVSDAGLFTGPPAAPGWSPAYFTAEVAPVSALSVDAGRAHPSVLPLPRTGDPAGQARSALAGALRATGVPVGTTRGGHLPPGARQVAVVQSPPVSDLVRRMLSWSDNDLAEALGRLTARAAGQPADFGGAARAVTAGLVTLGLPVAGLHLVDTSGLSHDDRVPPALLVATLRVASDPARPQLSAVLAGLPVAGRTGTLAHRFHDPQTRGAVGRVDAKTGRLAGMAALAGTVRTKDGRVLVFAVRAPSVDLTVGERAMDRIAATLASCGCRAGRT